MYPHHAEALRKADLAPAPFPNMVDILAEIKDKTMNKEKKKKRRFSRQAYFCIGYSDLWKGKYVIHIQLKTLRNKFSLPWIRTSMSYQKFPNLREQFQGDLLSKLTKDVGSLDFDTISCNCNIWSKVNGKFPYNSLCQHSIVVYKATCKLSGKFYIGNTQQKLKARLTQHCTEVKALVNKGIISDSFAKHAASLFQTDEKITVKEVRDRFNTSILW